MHPQIASEIARARRQEAVEGAERARLVRLAKRTRRSRDPAEPRSRIALPDASERRVALEHREAARTT